jgi:hypothetical protein
MIKTIEQIVLGLFLLFSWFIVGCGCFYFWIVGLQCLCWLFGMKHAFDPW